MGLSYGGVRARVLAVLETKTRHLSLHIFDHFFTLDVSSHNKIAALLFDVCDCVLERDIKLQPLVDVVFDFSVLCYGSLNLLETFVPRCFVLFKIEDCREFFILSLNLK